MRTLTAISSSVCQWQCRGGIQPLCWEVPGAWTPWASLRPHNFSLITVTFMSCLYHIIFIFYIVLYSVLHFVPYIYLFVCNLHLCSYCFSCMVIAVCVSVLLAEFVNLYKLFTGLSISDICMHKLYHPL